MNQIKLWARADNGEFDELKLAPGIGDERALEDALTQQPDLLMPGLQLVARQLETGSGPLDLLGVDPDGRLVLFELKRDRLPRKAVTQIVDYASALTALGIDELTQRIAAASGQWGIERIDSLDDWYAEQHPDADLAEQLPPQLILVGMGADPATTRMTQFLADQGLDISLLTFFAYQLNDRHILARQIEAEPPPSGRRRPGETPKAKVERTLSEIQSRPHAVLFEQVRALIEQLRLPMTDVTARAEPLGIGWGPSTQRGVAAYRLAYTLRGVDAASPSVRLWLSERAVHHAKRHFDATTPTLGLIEDPNGRHHRLSREEDALFPNARQLLIESTQHWDKLKDDVRGLIQAVNDNWYEADSTEQGESQ